MDVEKAFQDLREIIVLLGWSIASTKDPDTDIYCIVLFGGKEKIRVVLGDGAGGAAFRSDFHVHSEEDFAALVDRLRQGRLIPRAGRVESQLISPTTV